MNVDRRRFIRAAAGAAACTVLPRCASVAATSVTPVSGAVRLRLQEFPDLVRPAGSLVLRLAGGPSPIYLLALEDGAYAAVSPVCTHLGCTVDVVGERLLCPCHGSTYDREGNVLRGPAERALRRYPLTVVGDELVIRVEPS